MIKLKCLLFNNVLLRLANTIISILSVALVRLTVNIVRSCTCLQQDRDLQCNFTKNVYFIC